MPVVQPVLETVTNTEREREREGGGGGQAETDRQMELRCERKKINKKVVNIRGKVLCQHSARGKRKFRISRRSSLTRLTHDSE